MLGDRGFQNRGQKDAMSKMQIPAHEARREMSDCSRRRIQEMHTALRFPDFHVSRKDINHGCLLVH